MSSKFGSGKILLVVAGVILLSVGVGVTAYVISQNKKTPPSDDDDDKKPPTPSDDDDDDVTPEPPAKTCPEAYVGLQIPIKAMGYGIDLVAAPDKTGKDVVSVKTTDSNVKWVLVKHRAAGKYALKDAESGAFLTCGDGLDVVAHIIEDPPAAGRTWESFSVECLGNDKVAFKSNFGRYLGLTSDRKGFKADSKTITDSETFLFSV
jgi:hypothetical protein